MCPSHPEIQESTQHSIWTWNRGQCHLFFFQLQCNATLLAMRHICGCYRKWLQPKQAPSRTCTRPTLRGFSWKAYSVRTSARLVQKGGFLCSTVPDHSGYTPWFWGPNRFCPPDGSECFQRTVGSSLRSMRFQIFQPHQFFRCEFFLLGFGSG